MKRSLRFLTLCTLFCFVLAFLTSCASILRKQMREYYSDESVYVLLEGEVVTFLDSRNVVVRLDEKIAIEDWALHEVAFTVYAQGRVEKYLSPGDKISFHTVNFIFYADQKFPMVSIEKNGETLMSLEEGKKNLFTFVDALE